MHAVLFIVLIKANWNSWNKYKNLKKSAFQNLLQDKNPFEVCSEAIFFLFWKLWHQLKLRETQTTGCRTTWDLRAGRLLQAQEGSPTQNGNSQGFRASHFVLGVLGAMGSPTTGWTLGCYCFWCQETQTTALETHICQQLPRQATRKLPVRKNSASEWDS